MVRIVVLHGPPEAHIVSADEEHQPQLPAVGDEGTVVHILAADGRRLGDPASPGTRFFVEAVTANGQPLWLAEFSRDELELVRRPRVGQGFPT